MADKGERASGKRKAVAIGAVLIVLAAFLVILWGGSEQSQYERRAEQQAYENARHTERDIKSSCVGLPATGKHDCSVKAHREQRDNEREEEDLVAQKTSALWTFLMGAAAVAGVMLSTLGVWLVYITFEETRRSANETKRSVDAFMDAERARLTVVRPHHGDKDGTNPQAIVPVKVVNFGRSACKVKAIEWSGLDTVDWHEDWKNTGHAERNIGSVVPADGAAHFVWGVNAPLNKPYIGGHVIYDTQFSSDCRSYFLWKLGKVESGGGYGPDTVEMDEQGGKGWPEDT